MKLRDDLALTFRQIQPLLLGGLLVLVPLLYLLSGFYLVGAEQRGVVMRFGRIIHEQVMPGMHYHLPWPIDSVRTLPTTNLRSLKVDFSSSAPEALQPEITTGDEDLVDVALVVQYNIESPGVYLSSAQTPELLLEQIVRAQTLFYIGGSAIDPLLTTGRTEFQNHLKRAIQTRLNHWRLGLRVTSVQINRLGPPESIKSAFDDVARARSEKQKMIQESRGERRTRLTQARSQAGQTLAQAEARATEILETARGHRDRFLANWRAYQKAPAITRERVYLERLERILAPVETLLVQPQKKGR